MDYRQERAMGMNNSVHLVTVLNAAGGSSAPNVAARLELPARYGSLL